MPKEDRKPMGKAGLTNSEIEARQAYQSEKKLQENVAALLRQRNIWFHRARMDRRTTGPVGTPDFLFAVHGKAIAVECKSVEGELSDEQINVRQGMFANGWLYYVVRSEAALLGILNNFKE